MSLLTRSLAHGFFQHFARRLTPPPRGLLKNDHEFLSGLVSSTRIDHDARGLTARGALFTTKRVSFFWAVVSQLSRELLEGVRPYRLVVRRDARPDWRAAECGKGHYTSPHTRSERA